MYMYIYKYIYIYIALPIEHSKAVITGNIFSNSKTVVKTVH